MQKIKNVLSRLFKLFSKDSTNPCSGKVKITPKSGERESFEAKLLDRPQPFIIKKTGNAKHHAVRFLVEYENAPLELRVLTITTVNGQVKRVYNNFKRAWKDGTEFTGFMDDGKNPAEAIKASIEIFEETGLKKAA